MKISNNEINNIIDKYINNKDVYFRIYAGSDNNLQADEVTSDLETGLMKFKELILEAGTMEPDFIHIELFKSTSKSISRKPFFQKSIKLKKQTSQQNSLGSFGNLPESLGGLQGFLTAQVKAASTETKFEGLIENNRELKMQVEKFTNQNESLKEKYDNLKQQLSDKISDYNELKRVYDWDMKRMSAEKDSAIQHAERERTSSDRFLTIGGQIAANIMGVNKETLGSLLGESIPLQEQTSNSSDDVDFKPEFTGKKAEAANMADEIHSWIYGTIENNTDENAFNLTKNIYDVNKFMSESLVNIDTLLKFVQQTKTSQ